MAIGKNSGEARRSSARALAPWGHRPELDGLRAIAVYTVVAFHSGSFKGQGGFIGVDLFFVLSGYLVTNVLWHDYAEHGKIRLVRFYSRRARRLVPAALLAIVGSAALMLLVSGSVGRAELIDDARAAALWFANWHFIAESTDYFGADLELSPYAHFWSLSIEEQFYVGYPLLLWLLAGVSRRFNRFAIAPIVIAFVALASLVTQFIVQEQQGISRAYYGTDTRVYQLLAGALLALAFDHLRRTGRLLPRVFSAGSTFIVAMSLAGFFVLSSSLVQVSPGVRGLGATIVTLVALAGLESKTTGWSARLLGMRPLTYLGQISYGTYLWHWPVTVALRQINPETSRVTVALLSAVCGTGLAALSSQLVELPPRTGRPRTRSSLVIAATLMLSILVAIVTPTVLQRSTRPGLLPAQELVAGIREPQAVPPAELLASASEGAIEETGQCPRGAAVLCILREGQEPDSLSVHLIGDSHARSLVPALIRLADIHGFQLSATTYLGCPWQRNLQSRDQRFIEGCRVSQPHAYDRVLPDLQPDIVSVANLSRLDPAVNDLGLVGELESYQGLGEAELTELATRSSAEEILGHAGELVLLEPIPLPPTSPNRCLSVQSDATSCAFVHWTEEIETERIYRRLAAEDDRIHAVDIDTVSCPRYPLCEVSLQQRPIYQDALHVWHEYYADHADEIWSEIVAAVEIDA